MTPMTTTLSNPPLRARETAGAADRREWLVFAALMLVGWIVPLSLGGFSLYVGLVIAIYAISALGLQVMVGLAGQLSLGHAAFMGLGAYTTVLLQKNLGLSFFAAAAAGTALAAVAGLLMAQLIRLSGVYFKIATFGFGIIVYQIIANTTWLTGGHNGIRGIPPIEIWGSGAASRQTLFVLAMTALTVVYALLLRLCRGRVGRALQAIGQDEAAARSVGIPTERYRMAVITIGCAIAGLSGSFLPHLLRFLSPESFVWHESLVLLIMIAVGGLGSLPGAIVGTALMVIIPESLRELAEYKMLAYGLLLVLCMMFAPRGMAGLGEALFGARRGGGPAR